MVHRIALTLAFIWAGLIVFGQITCPSYRQYTLHDGLSQMQVTCLFQDTRGYIWVGTKGGLNCFNGEKFVNYTSKKYPKIENDQIVFIQEDSNGKIWGSTVTGLIRIDGEEVNFFHTDTNVAPCITSDHEGRMWFSESNYPLPGYSIKYIEGDNICTPKFKLPESKYYSSRQILFHKAENTLLLAVDSILYCLKNNKFEKIDRVNGCVVFFPNTGAEVFYIDGRDNTDVLMTDIKNSDIKRYSSGKSEIVASIRNYKYSFTPKFSQPIIYTQPVLPNVSVFLSNDSISYRYNRGIKTNIALLDRENQVWIGSEDGLYRLFDDAFTAYNTTSLPRIWSVLEDSEENLWFGSFMDGLFKMSDGKLTEYLNTDYKEFAHPYFHPSKDKHGRLFFPNTYGLLMIDKDKFEQKSEFYYMTTYYDFETDYLWAGAKGQVCVFDYHRNKLRIINEKQGLNVGMNVLTIGKDSEGLYWLGGGKSLARYNFKTDKLQNYNPGGKNLGCYTQCNDHKGRTWFGTKGGLFWYNSEVDSLIKIKNDELTDVVATLACIDSTLLLISQPHGIYLMDLQKYYHSGQMELYLYNEKNGFIGVEPGQDGAFTDSKGNVWITTSTELVRLDPKKLEKDKNYLNIRVDKCNGYKLPFESKEFRLEPNQNSLVLTFDAIAYNRPKPIQYSWKIGNDTIWSAWQEDNYTVISGLHDGLTTIKVRARINGLPQSNLAQSEVNCFVNIALYRQAWFFPTLLALVSLLVVLAIVLLVQTRTRMLQINKQAKTFQLQAILSQMNPHFIFNVMASLQSMILSANIEKANDYLVRMSNLVRGFLEASISTSSAKSKKLKNGEMPLIKELEILHTFIEFQQLIYPDRFDYQLELDSHINPEEISIPPMLIQPFVENAIRHGLLQKKEKGTLLLKITLEGNNQLVIIISDDGIGIKKAGEIISKSPLLFTSRARELTEKRIKLLNEMGYQIIYQTTSSDQGTTVTLKIAKHDP